MIVWIYFECDRNSVTKSDGKAKPEKAQKNTEDKVLLIYDKKLRNTGIINPEAHITREMFELKS